MFLRDSGTGAGTLLEMKFQLFGCAVLVGWMGASALAGAETTPRAALDLKEKTFTLGMARWGVTFKVGEDGRLYQRAVGAVKAGDTFERADEAYPQAGDGYIWEPALQAVHADGNTSTALLYAGLTRANQGAGRELWRVQLRDAAYPFTVTLCFRIHYERDVLEQWTEIRHEEPKPVILERMASTSLRLPEALFLTHFFGDWAKEMHPVTEKLTAGTKVLDSKLGVRAHQFGNPSFVLSWDGPPAETSGQVLAGSLAWSGSFQCAFDDNGGGLRALCAYPRGWRRWRRRRPSAGCNSASGSSPRWSIPRASCSSGIRIGCCANRGASWNCSATSSRWI